MNVPQKIAPGNRTYASATKYGKKTIAIGDSHRRRINRKLFNEHCLIVEVLLNILVVLILRI